ncbi:MAG: hypothetical protein HN341_13770 [Verrucomicrobia bacterium]|nr:hypothetical protein [Verrucomicrobiota bacterium]
MPLCSLLAWSMTTPLTAFDMGLVDDVNRSAFEAAGSGPFKPYADRDTVMSYYEVPPDVLEAPEALIEWAKCSLAIQIKGAR